MEFAESGTEVPEACYRQILRGSRFLSAKSISGTLLEIYPEKWFQGAGIAIGKKMSPVSALGTFSRPFSLAHSSS